MADVDRRIQLQYLLQEILGSKNVYFQPPSGIRMSYPAIVYSRNDIIDKEADNVHYIRDISYKLTVIDSDPDSEIVEKVSKLPKCSFSTHYVSDNLNHDVFTIIY